jgi:hypothetical protein
MRAATFNQPRWRGLVRAAWLALTGLSLVLYVAGLPEYGRFLQAPCRAAVCDVGQLTPETLFALEHLGVSAAAYSLVYVSLNLVLVTISVVIAAVIFLRRPNDWAAWTTSLLLITLPTGNVLQVLPSVHPAWTLPVQFIGWFTATDLGLAFYTFPDGRFVPRWTRLLIVGWALLMVFDNFSPRFSELAAGSILFGVLSASFIASLAVAQVIRYRRASTPTQRQQTKWVVAGTVLGFGLFVAYVVSRGIVPSLNAPDSLYSAFSLFVQNISQLIIALSIGFAVLRYRLWDIDLLINRVLVYGLLTAALTAVYFGGILIFQNLLRFLSGSDSPLATVASTLLLAALFRPLRARIQAGIDRRFYRRKYNATQVAAAFAARIRDEVDLDRSTEVLMAVVADTLAPSGVWLWLPPQRPGS